MIALRTERLLLDAPRESDIDAVLDACQDAEVLRWIPLPKPYKREDAEFFVRDYAPHGETSGQFRVWAIRQDDQPLIGAIELRKDDAAGSASIGCWLAPAARGKGFMREAHERILPFALDPAGMGYTRLRWESIDGNGASMRLAVELGFTFDPSSSHEVDFRGEKRAALSGYRYRVMGPDSADAGPARH